MSLLDEIDPLKRAALAELQAAPDLAALEQTKGAWIGPQGRFTSLMKQLGTLQKEEKPAAGKLINAAKAELEDALAQRRGALELKAALPRTLQTSRCRVAAASWAIASAHPGHRRHCPRPSARVGFVVADGPEVEDEYH